MQALLETKQAESQALAESLTALMKHLLLLTGRDWFAELERTGISLTQVKCLTLLAESEEPHSVKGLSDVMGLSLPGVSRAIDGLVQRGELSREEDPRDRRCKLVTVTPRGRQTYERLMAVRVAGVRRFVDELDPDEREGLARGLSAVAERVNR